MVETSSRKLGPCWDEVFAAEGRGQEIERIKGWADWAKGDSTLLTSVSAFLPWAGKGPLRRSG